MSLFNRIAILKHLLPAKEFGRCEFGLTARDNLDCICCDKCRYEEKPVRPITKGAGRYFVVVVLVVAVFVSAVAVNRFLTVSPARLGGFAESLPAGGESRDVNLQQIKEMIQQEKLSGKEAQYYRRLEE